MADSIGSWTLYAVGLGGSGEMQSATSRIVTATNITQKSTKIIHTAISGLVPQTR